MLRELVRALRLKRQQLTKFRLSSGTMTDVPAYPGLLLRARDIAGSPARLNLTRAVGRLEI